MIGRFFAYLEQWIVHRLSTNRTFQKIAVRMDDTIQNKQKLLKETLNKTAAAKDIPTGFHPMNLVRNFIQEVEKEMNSIKNGPTTGKK